MLQQSTDQPSLTAADSIAGTNSSPCQFVPAGTGPAYRSPIDQIRNVVTGSQTAGTLSWRTTPLRINASIGTEQIWRDSAAGESPCLSGSYSPSYAISSVDKSVHVTSTI